MMVITDIAANFTDEKIRHLQSIEKLDPTKAFMLVKKIFYSFLIKGFNERTSDRRIKIEQAVDDVIDIFTGMLPSKFFELFSGFFKVIVCVWKEGDENIYEWRVRMHSRLYSVYKEELSRSALFNQELSSQQTDEVLFKYLMALSHASVGDIEIFYSYYIDGYKIVAKSFPLPFFSDKSVKLYESGKRVSEKNTNFSKKAAETREQSSLSEWQPYLNAAYELASKKPRFYSALSLAETVGKHVKTATRKVDTLRKKISEDAKIEPLLRKRSKRLSKV
jgi:hypothetical protein